MATIGPTRARLTKESEKFLLQQYRQSVRAGAPDLEIRNTLVQANDWLIRLQARQIHSTNYKHVEYRDLLTAGYLGFLNAIDSYNPRSKAKLSTYAWWIVRDEMHKIARFCRWHGDISDRDYRDSMKLNSALARMPVKFNHGLDYDELASLLEWPVSKCERLVPALKATLSLETPLTKNGRLTLGDTLSDERSPSPETLAHLVRLKALVHQSLLVLTDREREAISYRFFDVIPEPLQRARTAARRKALCDRYRYVANKALKKLSEQQPASKARDLALLVGGR